MKKIVIINGSIHNDGNTSIMIHRLIESLNVTYEKEIINLSQYSINSCRACWGCGGKKNCIYNDDHFQNIFEKLKQADVIILATPVYSANMSGRMQMFLERCAVVCDMNEGILQHKIGASLSVARRTGALHAIDSMNHFFLNHEMFVVGSSYWTVGYGRVPGDIVRDEESIKTIDKLAENINYLLEKIS